MKKNVFALFLLNLIASPVQAVEVGDIMYHDRTFTATYIGASSAKMPIGLVYLDLPFQRSWLCYGLESARR